MDDRQSKLGMMIGLCSRARALVCGTSLACDAVRHGNSSMLLYAFDASSNTKKKITNCAAYYGVMAHEISLGTRELGKYTGKGRAVGCVAITDSNFINAINNMISR